MLINTHLGFLTVPPEVSVTATQIRIAVGQSTTLTCSIITSNPDVSTISWSFTNTSGLTSIVSGETGQTLQLSDIPENGFGIYTCTATNSEDLSGTGDITIEQGCKPTLIETLLPYNEFYTHYICRYTRSDYSHY